MTMFTIPKELAKQGDLVLVPRREYEDLLTRVVPSAILTVREKRALASGRKEIRSGKFVTLSQFRHELVVADR